MGNFMDTVAQKAAEIVAAEHLKANPPKPYGDVKYADPEGGKYPIDTEDHIRAAWSYVNMPKNAAVLGDKAPAVKARIIGAWKDVIHPDGPPSVDDDGDDDSAEAAAVKAIKDAAKKIIAGATKRVEKEITLTVNAQTTEVAKAIEGKDVFKSDAERRVAYGWASVATIGGEPVEDLQKDTITVDALLDFTHQIMKGQRAGKFEHEGDACNQIVEAIVLSDDLQKALGIDLGMEGLLIGVHVPEDANWNTVKDGDWMFSIAGTMFVEEAADV